MPVSEAEVSGIEELTLAKRKKYSRAGAEQITLPDIQRKHAIDFDLPNSSLQAMKRLLEGKEDEPNPLLSWIGAFINAQETLW